ncbi:biopolymer transporter ExbD [bacterium]|nr:biopolymer transporter ExbD [bacterium]
MSERKTFNEINITPLTDIFLVLLIIMMVIAPLLDQQGLNLTVPENVEQEHLTNQDAKILTVNVTEDDKYYIDGEEIAIDDLEAYLKKVAKDYPDGMMIETDGDSTHGAIVKVMDSARNSGITSISVSEI